MKISNFGQFWQGWRCYQKTVTIISCNYLYSFQGEFMIINKMRLIELETAFVWGDARKYFAPGLKNYRKSSTMLVRKRFSHDLWAKSYHNITFLLHCLWTIAFLAQYSISNKILFVSINSIKSGCTPYRHVLCKTTTKDPSVL